LAASRLAEHDREVARRFEAQGVQDIQEQGDRGSVLLRAWGADDLHACLVDLGALAAADVRPAVDRQDVREFVGRREVPEALGDEPGYGRRHLRAQEQHLVILVEELEGDIPELRLLYDLRVLERRREDLPVAEEPEAFPDLRLHVEQPGRLRRQDVAGAGRGCEFSGHLAIHK
jgi:hypothetical protein